MEYINHEEYIDDLIATSVGVDPIAMYYVQQKMDSLLHGNVKDLTESDPIHKEYIDDLITTSVGIDPIAMYHVQQIMDSLINENDNELTERDPMLSASVNEIIDGIDQSINNKLIQNNLRHDYVWFECPMDLWLDSQPEIKNALEKLPESNKGKMQDNFVWFASPLDKSVVSELDARLADKHPWRAGKNSEIRDYVWYEMIIDKWIESQSGLKEALDQLAKKMNKSDEVINEESNKMINNNKVA